MNAECWVCLERVGDATPSDATLLDCEVHVLHDACLDRYRRFYGRRCTVCTGHTARMAHDVVVPRRESEGHGNQGHERACPPAFCDGFVAGNILIILLSVTLVVLILILVNVLDSG